MTWLRVGLAVVLGASVLAVPPAFAQEAPPEGTANPAEPDKGVPLEPAVDSGEAKEVELDTGIGEKGWQAPVASEARVTLGAAGVGLRAGLSPVSVAAGDSAARGTDVAVRVFDQDTAARVGASGFVFEVVPQALAASGPAVGAGDARLVVRIDYTGLANRFGADFVDRLRVVELPACAVLDPIPKGCRITERLLDSTIDRGAGVITVPLESARPLVVAAPAEVPVEGPLVEDTTTTTAEVPAESTGSSTTVPSAVTGQSVGGVSAFAAGGGGGTVLAMTSGSDGNGGSFSATSLSQSGTWQVGPGSGGFSWSYPIPLQPGPAGDVPEMSLGYSSASIDGMTGGENNQSGQTGLGWGITEAFIERSYKSCNQDGMGTEYEDLCWFSDNAVLHLNGMTARIYPVGDGSWRMEQDPNWRITRGTRPATGIDDNGDEDGEYWRVRTPDGTSYTFGLGVTPEAGDSFTSSAWNVPVFHSPGEGGCTNGYGICSQAWRWNLDRVEDTNGNVTSLYYSRETNNYGLAGGTAPWGYTSGGTLREIRYGIVSGSGAIAHARLEVSSVFRCNTLSTITIGDPGACPAPTPSNGPEFPDVPNDLICVTACPKHHPAFYDTKRIYRFSSQVRDGGSWREVDAVRLGHDWVDNAEGVEALWLRYLYRSGYSEATGLALPPIRFDSNNLLENRVDHNVGAGVMPLKQYRLGEIFTDSGSRIVVTYGRERPCPSTDQWPGGVNASFTWDQNSFDCFPKWWVPPDFPQGQGFGGFHKYLVTKVETFDQVGGSPRMATSYAYEGTPAWHYDDNILAAAGSTTRTWSEWRGYQKMTSSSGAGGETQTSTQFGLFRGMHSDRTLGGGTKTVYVTPTVGAAVLDDRWLRGKPLEERYLNSGGGAINASVHEYSLRNTAYGGGGAAFWAGEVRRTDRRAAGAGTQYFTTETTFNAEELPETVFEDGWDTTPANDSANRCSKTTYTTPATGTVWKLAFPKETLVDEGNCAGVVQRRQLLSYDGLAHGATPSAGNVTTVVADKDSIGGTVTTTYEHDTLGQVNKTTDGNGNVTQIVLTPAGTVGYPTATTTKRWLDTTGASVHETKVDWHAERRTLPVATRDVNDKLTSIVYDGLGRTNKVYLPTESLAAAPALPSWQFDYQLIPDPGGFGVQGPIVVTSRQLQSKSPLEQLESYQVLDGNLRVRQSQVKSPTIGKTIVTDTAYDSRGLTNRVTLPQAYTATPGAGIVAVGTPANHDLFAYDELGRPINDEFFETGIERYQTTTTYTHDTVEVDPPVGGNTRSVTNALGQSWKVQEYNGTAWDTATYLNDAVGQMTSITDPANNQITYVYDRLGRRTNMTDPDAGAWAYTYDNIGNQTKVTDNIAATADLFTTYDRLSRPTGRYQTNTTDPNNQLAAWIYDLAPRAGAPTGTVVLGALHEAIRYQRTGPYQGTYSNKITSYDDRNRPVTRTQQTPPGLGALTGSFNFAYEYDSADHQTSVTYPATGGLAAETVTTDYTDSGLPQTLGTAGNPQYVTATAWDDRSRVDTRNLGPVGATNSVVRDYAYDTFQNLIEWKATRQVTPTTTAVIQHDRITLDYAGNVVRRKDDVTLQWECYGYDNRNRLTTAYTSTVTCPASPPTGAGGGAAPYNQTFTYATDSKILTRTDNNGTPTTRNYTYPTNGAGSTRPHAVADISGTTNDCNGATAGTPDYCYDTNGNLTGRPGSTATNQTLTWDVEHRLTQVDDNGTPTGGETNFVYDPDGTRLIRKTPTNTTLYLEGHELTLTGTTTTTKRYYSIGSVTVAVRDSATGALTYLLGDQLGSTSVSVNAAGGAPVVQRYLPYGAPRSSTGGSAVTDRGWIGQTKDTSTGLQYLNARYYDPAIGRFAATDPIVDSERPISLDRYGYGDGSPVTLSDPSGLRPPECNDTSYRCTGSNSGGWQIVSAAPPTPVSSPPASAPPTGTGSQPAFTSGGGDPATNWARVALGLLNDTTYCAGVFTPSYCVDLPTDIFEEYMIVLKPLGGASAAFNVNLGIHPDSKVLAGLQVLGVPAAGDAGIFRRLTIESDFAFLAEHAPKEHGIWPGSDYWLDPPRQSVQVSLANELEHIGGFAIEVWVNYGSDSQGVVTSQVGAGFVPTSENAPAR